MNVDTKTFPEAAEYDAGSDSYLFTDNATKASNVVIDNFSGNDRIGFTNADADDYAFSNDGADVMLSYNYNDTGIMNLIQLTGVVNAMIIYDLSSSQQQPDSIRLPPDLDSYNRENPLAKNPGTSDQEKFKKFPQ